MPAWARRIGHLWVTRPVLLWLTGGVALLAGLQAGVLFRLWRLNSMQWAPLLHFGVLPPNQQLWAQPALARWQTLNMALSLLFALFWALALVAWHQALAAPQQPLRWRALLTRLPKALLRLLLAYGLGLVAVGVLVLPVGCGLLSLTLVVMLAALAGGAAGWLAFMSLLLVMAALAVAVLVAQILLMPWLLTGLHEEAIVPPRWVQHWWAVVRRFWPRFAFVSLLQLPALAFSLAGTAALMAAAWERELYGWSLPAGALLAVGVVLFGLSSLAGMGLLGAWVAAYVDARGRLPASVPPNPPMEAAA